MENLSYLDGAIQILESRCEGLIVSEEPIDGKIKYTVTNETACYGLYSTGAKLHAVNFSCIRSASSRLYVDWEATRKDLYADNNVSKQHVSMIRKFIKTVMNMLEQMGITRHIAWVVENRTRFNPELGKWKPSFHIFADLWFPRKLLRKNGKPWKTGPKSLVDPLFAFARFLAFFVPLGVAWRARQGLARPGEAWARPGRAWARPGPGARPG